MKTRFHPKLASSVLITLVCLLVGPIRAQAKRDIEGQVFIVTKGGVNVKLGLVPIWVLGDSEMRALAEQAVELADAAALKKKIDEEGEKFQEIEDKAAKELTESGSQKVRVAVSEDRQNMLKSFEPFAATAERGMRLIEKIDKQKRGLDSREILSRLRLGSEFATKILVGLLAEKESDLDSDADGRFKISTENGTGWVVAYSQRSVGTIGQTDIKESEQYYWVVELPQKKPQLFLSNNNCDVAEAEVKLRVLASEAKTSSFAAVASTKGTFSSSDRSQQVYSAEKAAQEKLKAEKELMLAAEQAEKERIAAAERAEKERIAAIEVREREVRAVAEGVKDGEDRLFVSIIEGSFQMGDLEGFVGPEPRHTQSTDASEMFLEAYSNFQKAESLEKRGDATGSLKLYKEVAKVLRVLRQQFPEWTPQVVNFRAQITERAIRRLQGSTLQSVNVSAFFIAESEVTYGEWNSVRKWASGKGYGFTHAGRGASDKHPVSDVSWYDVVKWCNAKSEIEGLRPCYKVSGLVYRNGEKTEVNCEWSSNGYRLPTEAEWEKAARGGSVGKKYPNGDTLTQDDANFGGDGTREVKSYAANGYGIYDMAGNVWEWCWDWYGEGYARESHNPKGPRSGLFRIARGGGWLNPADLLIVSTRRKETSGNADIGFRLVRSSPVKSQQKQQDSGLAPSDPPERDRGSKRKVTGSNSDR
jgi:sulfatase modifying factor 1